MDEDSSEGWINWFCDLEGHDFFIEVDEDYITDSFNLFGLKAIIPRYDEALEMILSPDTPESEDLKNQNFLDLYQSAMDLYGLIHARFILSAKGQFSLSNIRELGLLIQIYSLILFISNKRLTQFPLLI